MHLGLLDQFQYFVCGQCGTVQIAEIPADLTKYYPSNYYSFSVPHEVKNAPLKRYLKKLRARSALNGNTIIGWFVTLLFGMPEFLKMGRYAGIHLDSSILDVGCGAGKLLFRMHRAGFTNLTGIDPFVRKHITYPNGISIQKSELCEVQQEYEFIMLHHSLEHMAQPAAALEHIKRILSPSGCVLIRIPIADSETWRVYRENWVGLDAPRHLHLLTKKSLDLLASRAGMRIDRIVFDGSKNSFVSAELYRRGIPLVKINKMKKQEIAKYIGVTAMKQLQRKAQRANIEQKGDQAGFYLRHA